MNNDPNISAGNNSTVSPLISAKQLTLSSENGSVRIYKDGDIDLIFNHKLPLVLSFPYSEQTGESKSQKIVREISSNSSLASRFSFGDVVIQEGQKLIERFYISVVPSVAVVYRGKIVFILSGNDISSEQLNLQCRNLLDILDSKEENEEAIARLEADARQYAARCGKSLRSGEWDMVLTSGFVCGVVMALSRYHLDGIQWLFPTGLAFAFGITNSNFRFNWFQKFVATGIMYEIGMNWRDIVEWGRMLHQN